MRFLSIIELFHEDILFCQCADFDTDILYPIPFSTTVQFDLEVSVAIGTIKDLPNISTSHYSNVILISPVAVGNFSNIPDNINFLCLQSKNISRSRDNILSIISFAIHACDNLKNVLFSRRTSLSFSGFLNIAANKLNYALIYLDSKGKVIDCAKTRFVQSWEQYLDDNSELVRNIRDDCRELPARVLRKNATIGLTNPAVSILGIPVRSEKKTHGVLTAISINNTFSNISRALLHEFSLYLSAAIQTLPRQAAPEDSLSYLLRAFLLTNVREISEEDSQSLSRKGWKTNDRYCVYSICFPSDLLNGSELSDYREKLEYKFTNSYFMENRDRLYMIYNLSIPPLMHRKEIICQLHNVLNMPPVIIGTSNSYTGIMRTYSARLQSETAIDIGEILDKGQNSYEYDRYEPFHLLMNCSSQMDLSMLIHPLISLLLAYDRENNTEYTKTLQSYLEANMHPSVAAQKLCIHKNTMDYRLKRIQEITHPRFEEPERVLAFRLSFVILTYLRHSGEFDQLRQRYEHYKNEPT